MVISEKKNKKKNNLTLDVSLTKDTDFSQYLTVEEFVS